MQCDITCEFYAEKSCIARKPHRCCETGRIIQPGEKYWRCTGSWEGEFSAFVQSDFAYRFARKLNGVEPPSDQGESCIPFGEIRDYVFEMRNDLPAEWVAEWDAEAANIAHGGHQ